MISFRARVINTLIRNRHWFRGRFRKEVFDMDTSIPAFRELCEKGANRMMKIPEGTELVPDDIAGIPAEWIHPAGAPANKVIMYVHGGGYVSGSCNDHRSFVSGLAGSCGFTTLQYEYRLAPEHPYPAALDDSLLVYCYLLKKGFLPGNILLAGESAGGGLLLALLLALKDKGKPMPAAALAISPWTDLSCSADSYHTKNRVSAAPRDSWLVFSKHYAGSHNVNDPYLSPLFGELKGLPPLYINAAVDDELYDDGAEFARRAKEAGNTVTFVAGKGMLHCYPLLSPHFREAREAMDGMATFINAHLNALT